MTVHPLKDRAVQLWRLGYDTAQIARLLNVAESWVCFVLAEWREGRAA